MPPNGQPTQQLGESEQSVDCAYVNEYCLLQHKGNIRCETTFLKGRIIVAERAFKVGEVIFVEPPLRIVATKDGDDAWEKLSRLCRENEDIFPYDALWYWTALCSLTIEQLPVGSGIASVSEEVQRRLLLLYHPVDVCASEASCLLVEAFDLQVDAADMERLLQVWILNCFEHSDEPPAYVQYFLSAFMSHSCHPTAVWYNEGDDYVLRARCMPTAAVDAFVHDALHCCCPIHSTRVCACQIVRDASTRSLRLRSLPSRKRSRSCSICGAIWVSPRPCRCF
eukprot:TRINITY_DN31518_c0_g1_i1.p1 TRINITY_DN31518_c0_g1~~TRINITY_DN31518_c0_g1_i1.p1  ORF type:complete len:281 (+),score=36.54 TRINITY_DN31518_c0_g1_i1:63-905(+)